MGTPTFPPLSITESWGRLNDALIRLVDYIPEDKLEWCPKRGLWNFRGIVLHVSMARHNWLANGIEDGEATPDVLRDGQSKVGMQEQLRLSWGRIERFLTDPDKLAAEYSGDFQINQDWRHDGHWIAFHLLEHDVHHRADLFHYLALLDIEHPEVGTP